MNFLYPLGLLGLIGIPILIIIYIIKNKYTEQTVSSTYIWTLSERFLKRKNPINKIAGIISLILQILAVLFLSFGIAHPVFTVPGMANKYCIVLDCSGSMRTEQGSSTRFDHAKDEIRNLVNGATDGSAFTLVCAGDATTVYEETTDKKRVLSMLDQTEAGYAGASLDSALSMAQEIFDADTSTLTYLYTDKNYENHQNVEVVNLSNGEQNYALSEVTYTMDGGLEVSGTVTSYESDATLTLNLSVVSGEQTYTEQLTVETGSQGTTFTFDTQYSSFDVLSVSIAQEDAQPLDNTVVVYSAAAENSYSVLIVSDNPFFLQMMFNSTGNAVFETISTEDYTLEYGTDTGAPSYPSGYGLYVYDSFNPQVLPRDGSIWLFGLDSNLPDANFSVQTEVELESSVSLEFSTSTSSTVTALLNGVIRGQEGAAGDTNIHVYKYIKCSPYRNYTSLATCQGSPVIFTTQSAYGNREVVFATTFTDSDMSVTPNFLVLFLNLLEYSFPSVVENPLYNCGDTATVNVVGSVESIRVDSPGSETTYLDTSGVEAKFLLDEVGTYTITVETAGTQRVYRLYSAFPQEESVVTATEYAFSLSGEQSYDGYDGTYDALIILFSLLAVVFIADWVVYCYEQYQLR